MSMSKRSAVLGEPAPFAAALEAARQSRRPLIDLTNSNPTRVALTYDAYASLLPWALAEPSELWRGYAPEALGLSSARQAIAAERARPEAGLTTSPPSEPLDPERVLVVASSSEAYSYLFSLLCDADEELLIPRPSYPLLAHLGHYAGVRLVPYRLAYDGAWHIDFESLSAAIGPKSRAIVVVNPNNPTGSYLQRDELARLAAFGLPLIVDEVFARFALAPEPGAVRSALGQSDVLTFCLDGLSKSAGLPQLKLGWVAVSGPERAVREAMRRLEWLGDTYLSAATPTQRALPELLAAAGHFRAELLGRLRENERRLRAALAGSAASVLRLEGGWYAIVRLPEVASEDEWVLGLLQRESVAVHPGYFYDFERPAFLVLSLLPEPGEFQQGVAALTRELARRVR